MPAMRFRTQEEARERKLCILKGIFPREPKKKKEGNQRTYYHQKDINFLFHEPLLGKFRYPSFVDALRDLDDCLTMVHIFAALPAVDSMHIQVDHIHNCRRLSHEWQAYISRTHCLRKTFISVKGIYYQADVKGQEVTWLTPHALQQVLTDDVDYNIMLTFLEFYEVPRESLLFVIRAFGGMVSWERDGSPFSETDKGITHQIVDRPPVGHKFLSREYVQPQWIHDCENARIVLPTELYLVGRVPPPHLCWKYQRKNIKKSWALQCRKIAWEGLSRDVWALQRLNPGGAALKRQRAC